MLERGGVSYGKPNFMSQEGFLTTLMEVDAFDSPAQAFTSEDGVPNARGRVLGGSSAINAGFYSRADQEFYGRSGVNWDLRVVNQSYEWVERAIVFRPELKNWQSAVRDGLLEAGVDPYNGFTLDHIQWVPRLVVRHSTVLVVDTVLLISSAMRKLRIFEWLSMQVLKEFF